jgi:hypothetical protein
MSKTPALKPWSVSTPVPSASLTSLLFVVVIVGCVYVGREVLVPMALAILLSFALTPPVELLQIDRPNGVAPSTSAAPSAVLKPTRFLSRLGNRTQRADRHVGSLWHKHDACAACDLYAAATPGMIAAFRNHAGQHRHEDDHKDGADEKDDQHDQGKDIEAGHDALLVDQT